jgi:tyrosyl-tRNA synthetase
MAMDHEIQELLTRGVSDVVVRKDLEEKLKSGKKLRVKHGVDPTTSDLHLGYAVIYEKLRRFQELGHTVVFMIGGFTARFGDPTDKGDSREMRFKEEVDTIAAEYVEQLAPILDLDKIEVQNNADWWDKMSAEDLLRVMSEFTVAQMLERDMFQDRIKAGKGIGLHEIVYPVLQGYDSVPLDSDLTVIGTDQTFNELQARPLQERNGRKGGVQDIVAMRMLPGLDGQMKMSQSLGNYIAFRDEPNDMFGKVMSIPDELIFEYFECVTRVPLAEIEELREEMEGGPNGKKNPRDYKMRLGREIVTIYHSVELAAGAEEAFVSQFSKGEVPEDMPSAKVSAGANVVDVLVADGMVSSKNEAKRLIEGGGVKIDGEKVSDVDADFDAVSAAAVVLQAGKRKFLKVIF